MVGFRRCEFQHVCSSSGHLLGEFRHQGVVAYQEVEIWPSIGSCKGQVKYGVGAAGWPL